MSENSGRLSADEFHQRLRPLGLVQPPQPLGQRECLDGRRSHAAPAGPAPAESQPPEQGRLVRPAAQGGRVELHRYENGVVDGEGGVEEGHALLCRQAGQSSSGAAARARPTEPVDHAAGLFPGTPGEGGRCEPLPPSDLGQRVEEGVGGRVVPLAGRPQQAGGGREEREHRQVQIAGQPVQMPGGVRLGLEHRVDTFAGERGDDAVVEYTRGVDHGGQRVFVVDGGEKAGERVGVGDVAGRKGDGCGAELLEFGGEFLSTRCVRPAPAGQHEVTGTVRGDQVPGEYAAERSGASGEKHGSVPVERLRNGEHDLSHVPGLAEEAEGLRCPADVPGPHGQWTQCPALEQRDNLGQHPADPLGPCLYDVERLVGDSRMGMRDRFGIAYVRLAHLHEPTAARQQPQRGVHERPGEGIQHDVDATSVGGGEELLLELQRARGRQVLVVQPEPPQGVPLARACRPEHLGAEVARQLCGRHADTARRGVHEDRLPRLECGEVDQTVVSGEEHDGHRGCLGERPSVGNLRDHALIGHRGGAETAAQQAHDPVTRHDPGHAGAGLQHDAGTLDAHRGVSRIHVESNQDVAEVEPRCAYGHAHLAGFEFAARFRVGQQPQSVERPLAHAVEPPGRPVHRRQQCAVLPGPHEAEGEERSPAYGQLRLTAVHGTSYDTDVGPRRFVQIQQDEALGVLRLRRPQQAPHRGGGQVGRGARVAARVDGPTGDDDQPGRVEARIGQPLLQEPERTVRCAVRGSEDVGVLGRAVGGVDQDDFRSCGPRVEGCGQRGHVRVHVTTVGARAGSIGEHGQHRQGPCLTIRLRGRVLGDLDPAQLEQRVRGGTVPVVELLSGHLTHCQRVDVSDELTGGIGQDQ